MPIPNHCVHCDKPVVGQKLDHIHDDCLVELQEIPIFGIGETQMSARTTEGIIPYIERMPEPKPLNDSFIDTITQGKADIENIITLNDLSQEK
ncbi:MAG: hypothetical protein H8D23_16605 [Candidatus Brocadiales bacterium]|nr:hypothetical protein [Candidatus Brocadiales bacterium]